MSILKDIQQLNVGNIITLYELDLANCISESSPEIFRWCDGVNELGNDVVWNGVPYIRYPVQATGFDKLGNGQIPRPKLVASNIGGILSSLAKEFNDLVGAKLTRTRTFARYLDAINFKRYNTLLYSNNFNNAIWQPYTTGSAVGTYTYLSDSKYGSVVRITKTGGAVGDRFGIKQTVTGLTGTQFNFFSYIKPLLANLTGSIYVEAGTTSGTISKTINITGAETPNVWSQKAAVSSTGSLTGSAVFYISVDGTNGSSIEFTWPQLSSGSQELEYQAIGASANPFADPTQYLDREIWTIDRKANENNAYIEWELTAPFDLLGVKIPRRQCIQNMCNWKYKSSECGWIPVAGKYFDIKDISVTDPTKDICGKRVSSCKKRFGETAVLPYGGFPAVGI